jgi:hypothetical protein
MSPRPVEQTPKRTSPRRLAKHRLDQLVEEAIIDAYGELEQRVGLLTCWRRTWRARLRGRLGHRFRSYASI